MLFALSISTLTSVRIIKGALSLLRKCAPPMRAFASCPSTSIFITEQSCSMFISLSCLCILFFTLLVVVVLLLLLLLLTSSERYKDVALKCLKCSHGRKNPRLHSFKKYKRLSVHATRSPIRGSLILRTCQRARNQSPAWCLSSDSTAPPALCSPS